MKTSHTSIYGKGVIFLFVTPAVILINFLLNWPLVKLSGLSAGFNFADLLSTTSTIACYREIGFDVYSSTNTGYCGNYIYGRELLLILSNLPIYPSQLNILGTTAVMMFCVISVMFTYSAVRPKISTILFTTFIIVSPGTSLLLERANIDVFMILGIFVAALLISKDKAYSGYLILALLTMFKFYTLPLFALILILEPRGRKKLVGFFLLFLTTILSLRSILSIQARFPEDGYAQFGLNIIGDYLRKGLNLDVSPLEARVLGYASFAFLLVGLSYLIKMRHEIDSLNIKNSSINLFGLYSGVIFISCYITGLSYDYRLPFLIFSSLWILNVAEFPRRIRILFQVLVVLACWFSTGFGASIRPNDQFWQRYAVMGGQALGDLAIWILAGFLCVMGFENLKKRSGNWPCTLRIFKRN